jgi:predicted dehydrogenase
MYRCGIVGVSGGRAQGHADAYGVITRGRLVAVSSRQGEKRDAFAQKYQVAGRYGEYEEMFARERLDVVHVNTPPTVRGEVIEAAGRHGVKALIIEKPVGIQGEDYTQLRALAARSAVKVAVNHQLHFHPNRMALQERVRQGEIGDVVLIDASARLNMATQGTHMLQGIGAFNRGARATRVFACASGAGGLAESSRAHFAPDEVLAEVTYDSGARAVLRCGLGAPVVKPEMKPSMNKRISVYGTKGQAHWTMWGWRFIGADGKETGGAHDYFEQDVRAQALMTEAMFDWLEDETKVHPLNLNASLDELEILLGAYTSVVERRVVELPLKPGAALIERLRWCLAKG